MDKPVDGIEKAFTNLETTIDASDEIRKLLVEKLKPVIEAIDFGDINTMRASELESKLGVFSTLDSILKSTEAMKVHDVRLNLQGKSDDDKSDHAAQALEILKQLSPLAKPNHKELPVQDMSEVDAELAKIAEEECIPIGDDEMVQSTTMDTTGVVEE